MLRLTAFFGLLVLFLLAPHLVAAQDQEAPPAPQLREENLGPKPDWSWLVVLRFMTEADYPPFNYRDEDGQLTGFNVDLARAICKELEVTCEVNTSEWGKLVGTLNSDQADAVIASLAITPKTLAQVDFTTSYYATPAKFVTLTSSKIKPNEVTPEGLEGRTIAVVKDTSHEAYLRHFFANSTIVAFAAPEEAYAALKNNNAELLFGDAIGLMFWLNGSDSAGCCQFRGGGYLESEYFGEGVGIAVPKGNIRLQEVLNYALSRLRASGRFEELQRRHFPLAIY